MKKVVDLGIGWRPGDWAQLAQDDGILRKVTAVIHAEGGLVFLRLSGHSQDVASGRVRLVHVTFCDEK
jgi:hypothetical protein